MTDLERQLELAKAKQDLIPQVSLSDEAYQYAIDRFAEGNTALAANKTIQKQAIAQALLGLSMGLSLEDATDRGENSAFTAMLNKGYSDPGYSAPVNDASQLNSFGAKMRVIQDAISGVTNVGNNEDTRNIQAAVTSGDAIGGLRSATGEMFGVAGVDFKSTIPGTDPIPVIVDVNGNVVSSLSSDPSSMVDTLARFGVKDLSSAQAAAEKARQFSPVAGNRPQEVSGINAQTFANAITQLDYRPPVGPSGLINRSTAPAQNLYTPTPTPNPIQETVTDAVTTPTTKPTYQQTTQNIAKGQTQTPMTPQGIIQRPDLGTSSSPLQTAGLSAVPDNITVRPNYTGTTMANLTMPSQGQQNIQAVMYSNDMGQTVTVTEINGQPTTYVPPGFKRMSGQTSSDQQAQAQEAPIAGVTFNPQTLAEGGSVGEDRSVDAMYRMASQFLGYKGPKTRKGLEEFAKSSPGAASKMKAYTSAMAKGGLVKGYQEGGSVTQEELSNMSGNLMRQTLQPIQAPTSFIQPQEADFIAPTAGMTVPQAPFAESATVQNVEQANLPQVMTPATFTPTMAAPAVAQETANLQAAQGQVSQGAQVQGAQQEGTAVSNLEAAQGEAVKMNNPVQREIQAGELISGSAVDATKVEALNSQMQAAEATPSSQATVQGQLEGLMTQFEGGKVPAWAAGAMRGAMAQLSARGLGASSLAGQAVVQAAMESAIPIAQIDAQTRAQFESQNLSNRQQTAMAAAQQRANFLQIEFDQEFQSRVQNSARIADIANMNFTAEQQIALENSRNANTVNLQNLGNRQAMTMAEAASLANLDMANLNNRQQAAVQNAQSFLQMDLTNLNNEQQTELFKSQQNIQSLFTDQAAENASLQFNAASENQTKQFFSNLTSQVGQFNATQRNAMDQFNVNSVNAMRQFNSEVQQQRDLFNAQNGLVIAQANAQWRQNIATLNTSAQNESNSNFAKTINGLTQNNLDQIWQRERDIMSFAVGISEGDANRNLSLLLGEMEAQIAADGLKYKDNAARSELLLTIADTVFRKRT